MFVTFGLLILLVFKSLYFISVWGGRELVYSSRQEITLEKK